MLCPVMLQSLGVSKELKDAGYALMCVSFPRSDAVLEGAFRRMKFTTCSLAKHLRRGL